VSRKGRGQGDACDVALPAALFPPSISWQNLIQVATLCLPMPPRRQDDIMDVDSDESDALLDYDEPRRKGKGKAPKKKDKGKGKVTEVGITPRPSEACLSLG